MTHSEEKTVEEAMEALNEAGVGFEVRYEPAEANDGWDHLTIQQAGRHWRYAIYPPTTSDEILGVHLAGAWEQREKGRSAPRRFVVVARRLTPAQTDELRRAGVAYLDAAGNAFLKDEGLFVLLVGRRKARQAAPRAGAAFQASGLKCLAYWLEGPEQAAQPIRAVTEWAGVSLSTAAAAMSDLTRLEYVSVTGTRRSARRRWHRIPDLLRRWADGYVELLRPRLRNGAFRPMHGTWADLDVARIKGVWSGEAAADLLGLDLRAGGGVLYTRAPRSTLATDLGLIPDPQGHIEVFERFWKGEDALIAPTPIVIADLNASGDARARAAAGELLDRWARRWAL